MINTTANRRYLGLSVSSAVLLTLAACSVNGGNPSMTSPQHAASVPARSSERSDYIDRQIAAGNIARVCPTPVLGGFRCMMFISRHPERAPRTKGVDGKELGGYGPPELQAAYDIVGAAKSNPGGLVALVEAGGYPALERDLATYRAEFGLPKCSIRSKCLQIVNQEGQAKPLPSTDPDADEEQALDVDMVSANCPNCHILVVQNITSYYVGENTAASFAPVAISNSWGFNEFSGEQQYVLTYFTHPGIAMTAAAGDSGYGVIFPAAAGTVTAVGGTSLRKARGARGFSETVWPGTGGGCSQFEQVPSWQAPLESGLGGCSNRIASDVSYDADPSTGLAIYDSMPGGLEPPGWQVVGGTSAGAPAIAALYALSGNTTGVPASIAYANAGDLYDITSGSDGSCSPAYLCNGEAGYDAPTGLGSPNGLGAF